MEAHNNNKTDMLKDRKNRNLMDFSREEITSLSCKFTSPYADEDAIKEKIRMNNIFGKQPPYLAHSQTQHKQVQGSLTSNQTSLFKSLENIINQDDTLIQIFQKMKTKPLIQNIIDYFIEENNSKVNQMKNPELRMEYRESSSIVKFTLDMETDAELIKSDSNYQKTTANGVKKEIVTEIIDESVSQNTKSNKPLLVKNEHQSTILQQHRISELKSNNLKRSAPSPTDVNNKIIKLSAEDNVSTNKNPTIKITSRNKLFNNTTQTNPSEPKVISQIPNQAKSNVKQKLGSNFDFLYKTLSEETFYTRGINKKHEADSEKQYVKKLTLYMEAVCFFCLCAINQYRINKTKTVNSIELLNQTWNLLKYINEISYKTKNIDFTKKFKVLSNWMESFIFHWLWKLNLNESKNLSKSLNNIMHSLTPSIITPKSTCNISPNEILESPNSVCSTGSHNSHVVKNAESSQNNELSLLRELHSKMKSFWEINNYNISSQSKWDENEAYIISDKHILDYRETIKTQVEFQLNINCEVEELVLSVFKGLQLLELYS
jgi:hypothetical protein